MQFPQMELQRQQIRAISTSDIAALAQFQPNKNRYYTQLQSGVLAASYQEVNLGQVQIFRESLTTGARIQAAPARVWLPFAAILPHSGEYRFCGREGQAGTLIQASGGEWDICFKERLDYVSTALDRQAFSTSLQRLTGEELPQDWCLSLQRRTDATALSRYTDGIASLLHRIHSQPQLLSQPQAQKLLGANVLELVLAVMMPAMPLTPPNCSKPRRRLGVKRVIDYLQAHAARLPTIPELCQVAELSERSLEYGFRDELGMTPVRYLRMVRLNGARCDLLRRRGQPTSVAEVALTWGFMEFGRFAGEYRKLFHELPSQTLKQDKPSINHTPLSPPPADGDDTRVSGSASAVFAG
ncbi:helix-turn-helix domain-containing protein [Ferrimonas sp. SCSIO 43195]|nr:helix-turn-helix domain-containing protein [Ferrimonas sp. SCSIO 43195]